MFLDIIVHGLIGFYFHDLSHESKVVQILDFLQSCLVSLWFFFFFFFYFFLFFFYW